MRYIGGKSLILENIESAIHQNTKNVSSVLDIFSGSGTVSQYLKTQGYKVYSNDFLYFSYILNSCIELNEEPRFENLKINDPISYLNNLNIDDTDFKDSQLFIYNNYSPNDKCDRMYFQEKNAKKIDIIRLTIEKWKNERKINDKEYKYLLCSLLNAVPYVANITGVYAAYLKFWDKRTYNDLILKPIEINNNNNNINICFNKDYHEILEEIEADLMYADPPYNSREYLPNYHILETIAKYDYPLVYGKTGVRNYDKQKSEFCKKATVKQAFINLISNCKCKYILISYNNEGLLSTEELSDICKEFAVKDTFKLIEFNYRRYKSKIVNTKDGLKEQLYFLQRW